MVILFMTAGIALLSLGAVIGYAAAIIGVHSRKGARGARYRWWNANDRALRKLLNG